MGIMGRYLVTAILRKPFSRILRKRDSFHECYSGSVMRQDWKQDWKRIIAAAVIVGLALGGAVSALRDSQRETVRQTSQADFPS